MDNFDNKLNNVISEIESDLSDLINQHGCTSFWMSLKGFPSFRRNFNQRFTYKQRQRLVDLISDEINYRYGSNTFTRYEFGNVCIDNFKGNLSIHFYVIGERY